MKKRIFNKQQKAYMTAQVNLKTLERIQNGMETLYIKEKGIINEDGTTPQLIYMIDAKETFESANVDFSKRPESEKVWAQIIEAREVLKSAEENLLEYGLNDIPVPAKEKEVLICQRTARTNINIVAFASLRVSIWVIMARIVSTRLYSILVCGTLHKLQCTNMSVMNLNFLRSTSGISLRPFMYNNLADKSPQDL